MSHGAEISMVQALMKVGESVERVDDAIRRIEHANSLDPLPQGGIDLIDDLRAHHAGLKRNRDTITEMISGRKAVTA